MSKKEINLVPSDKKDHKKLGNLATSFFTCKEDIRKLDNQKKEINKNVEKLTKEIDGLMENHDMESFKCPAGSLSRKIAVYPSIVDFTIFFNWVAKTGSTEFIQKRVNAAPVREMLVEQGLVPPGLDTYEKAVLNARVSSEFRTKRGG